MMKTLVTFDTNTLPLSDIEHLIKNGSFHIAYVSVTERELENTDLRLHLDLFDKKFFLKQSSLKISPKQLNVGQNNFI